MSGSSGVLSRAAEGWRRSRIAQLVTYAAVDLFIVWVAVLAAYALRFDGAVPPVWAHSILLAGTISCVVFCGLFLSFGLYHFVWKYVGVDMMVRLGQAVAVGTLLLVAGTIVASLRGPSVVPMSIPILVGAFVFMGAAAFRSLGRLLVYTSAGSRGVERKVLIVGAGDAGSLLLRDIENQPALGMNVVGFLDDDRAKQGRSIRRVKVLGGTEMLPELVVSAEIDEVLIAVPRATLFERRRILDLCNQVHVAVRLISGLAFTGTIGVADLRPVSIEDLLGRDPVRIDETLIRESLEGRVVAVTGAAGSIGSELCRQILEMDPLRLLLVEIDETRLYELYLELEDRSPGVCRMHLLDIRDEAKLEDVFRAEKPEVVFHAAAYKHVPMMELSPDEAVKTNVGGTWSVIRGSQAAGVSKFVLISTDKAVAPANIMGATKALAERLTMLAAQGGFGATAVRFGNVLGSRGSVVPLFTEQLRKGGPVLVTHPEVTRYFMTIPEAARLVLQAQAMSVGGEVFVLDMGEPVRIVDLARKMIALSNSNAKIEFTTLRPGEKLHEVLVHGWSSLVATDCEKVSRVGAVHPVDPDFAERAKALVDLARRRDTAAIHDLIGELIPDFVHAGRGREAVPTALQTPEDDD